jgi:hypothetical protein
MGMMPLELVLFSWNVVAGRQQNQPVFASSQWDGPTEERLRNLAWGPSAVIASRRRNNPEQPAPTLDCFAEPVLGPAMPDPWARNDGVE